MLAGRLTSAGGDRIEVHRAALTLLRDTYRSADEVRELLEFGGTADRSVSREDIVGHLLDRVLATAYQQRPGNAPPGYSLHTAQSAPGHIAARMNQDNTRDLSSRSR